jgi:hypothetical protein
VSKGHIHCLHPLMFVEVPQTVPVVLLETWRPPLSLLLGAMRAGKWYCLGVAGWRALSVFSFLGTTETPHSHPATIGRLRSRPTHCSECKQATVDWLTT